jgi:Tfp pilus assembly protein PilN
MRYRVNIYPDREDRGAVVRKNVVRGVRFGLLAGIEIVLIGLLALSGVELTKRTRNIEHSTASLQERAADQDVPDALAAARELVRRRVGRVDWTSQLDALARTLPPGVTLTQIQGLALGQKGSPDGLTLAGTTDSGDLDSVLRFVEALRARPEIADPFPRVELETAGGRQTLGFKITCRPAETGEEAP